MTKLIVRFKGGKGSGNFGHQGRIGQQGGSTAGGSGRMPTKADAFRGRAPYNEAALRAAGGKGGTHTKGWKAENIEGDGFIKNEGKARAQIRKLPDGEFGVTVGPKKQNKYDRTEYSTNQFKGIDDAMKWANDELTSWADSLSLDNPWSEE